MKKLICSSVFISLIFFMYNQFAMDLPKESEKQAGFYNQISWSVYFERLKSIHVLASRNAQMKKYGAIAIDPDLQSRHSESLGENVKTIQFKQMNEVTAKKLGTYGSYVFGSKDLFGRKTVWINQELLQKQPQEVQEYLLTCGVEQAKLINPDLKMVIASESLVALASYTLFVQANLTKKRMADQKIEPAKSFESLSSLLTWDDVHVKKNIGHVKKRLRPGVFKALGWATSFVGPLMVIPQTPLEKSIVQNHKFTAIESTALHDTGITRLNLAKKALFLSHLNDAPGLPEDELEFMNQVVKKQEKLKENFSIKDHTLCVKQCENQNFECKELTVKEMELRSLEATRCRAECGKRVKAVSGNA